MDKGGGVRLPWEQWYEIRRLAIEIMDMVAILSKTAGMKGVNSSLQQLCGRFDTALGLPWGPDKKLEFRCPIPIRHGDRVQLQIAATPSGPKIVGLKKVLESRVATKA